MILIDFNWLKIKYPVTALWRLSGIHEALTRAVSKFPTYYFVRLCTCKLPTKSY